jgi:RNA polymerase sigma factor (sigma-70 family)
MPGGPARTLLTRVRQLVAPGGGERSDEQLLSAYVLSRSEEAFAALVCRHGPMVYGLCRRLLRGEADAEDAFQATFLVLVRKAVAIRPRGMVGNWLYGVAYRTALKVRALAARRLVKEQAMARTEAIPAVEPSDLQNVLDEELERLPAKYRAPLVLCELEGRSRREAAAELDLPEGTVAARLSRGREELARRMRRRGFSVFAPATMALLTQQAQAAAPMHLVAITVRAASLAGAGQGGAVSTQVAGLVDGVVKAMLIKKLKRIGAAVVLAALTISGAGLLWSESPTSELDANNPPRAPLIAEKARAPLTPAAAPAPEPPPATRAAARVACRVCIVLPPDPDAIVISYNRVDGDRQPEMTVYADGRVHVLDPQSRDPRIEAKLSPDDLHSLLHYAIYDCRFFELDARNIKASMRATPRAGANPALRAGGDRQVRIAICFAQNEFDFDAIHFYAREFPSIEGLRHFGNLTDRLDGLLRDLSPDGRG